jgi:hypothetical protein
LSAVSWLLRALLGAGGILLAFTSWPVAVSALYFQQADAVVSRLRENRPINLPDALAAIDAADRAVSADPTGARRLLRSELLAGAAAGLNWAAPDSQRNEWLRTAASDLEDGLATAPARGIAWLRLASIRYILEGPSPGVVVPLLMSIETAPVMERMAPIRTELISRNWGSFSEGQLDKLGKYIAEVWRQSTDRRGFVGAIRRPEDELYLRYLLRDVPGAQEELTQWLLSTRR